MPCDIGDDIINLDVPNFYAAKVPTIDGAVETPAHTMFTDAPRPWPVIQSPGLPTILLPTRVLFQRRPGSTIRCSRIQQT
jgi:hypothetical protein